MSRQREARKLCQQILECKDEAQAIELARQLQTLLHEHIDSLRDNVGENVPFFSIPNTADAA
jgi:hypothetical protein